MKFFSVVSGWFSKLIARFSAVGSHAMVETFEQVENIAFNYAIPAVTWVGDVVVTAIQQSHLPLADIIEQELQKYCPDIPDIRDKAVRLASKDRPDMLLSLAVLVMQATCAKSVPLRILRAAAEVAYLIYSAQKGK